MPRLLKSLFRNAGIPVAGSFEGHDRWEAGAPSFNATFVEGGDPAPGAGGGGGEGGGAGGGNTDPKPTGKSGGLSDTEASLLREVMEKKTKLQEVQTQLEQVNARLKDFEGLDAAEMRSLLAEKKLRETQELEAKGQWESLKKQMSDAHAAELEAERKRTLEAQDAKTKLERRIDELAIGNAFGQSKFIVDELNLPVGKTRALFGPHFDVVDGLVVGYDKPLGAKNRTMLVDGSGNPLPFDTALQKLVDADPDAENLRKSKLKTGAGSGGEPGVVPPTKDNANLSGRERIRLALQGRKK